MATRPIALNLREARLLQQGKLGGLVRPVRPQPVRDIDDTAGPCWLYDACGTMLPFWEDEADGVIEECPMGEEGDELWVQEPWAVSKDDVPAYPADYANVPFQTRRAIYLPARHSRATLLIEEVRLERLFDLLARGGRRALGFESLPEFQANWRTVTERKGDRSLEWQNDPWVWSLRVAPK